MEQENHNFEQLEYIGEYLLLQCVPYIFHGWPLSQELHGGHAGDGDDADPLFHFPRALIYRLYVN